MRIEFTAYGVPKPAGSKRAFAFKRKDGTLGATVTDACKDTKSWQHVVASAAREAYQGELLLGAIRLHLTFRMPRPKAHLDKIGAAKPGAPFWHTKRPDRSKLTRAVEDALTSVVWHDDAQVVDGTIRKVYGAPSSVEVVIEEVIF